MQSRSGRGAAQQQTQPPQSASRSPGSGRRARTSGQGVAANLNSKAETRENVASSETSEHAVPTKAGEEWETVPVRKTKPSMVATTTTTAPPAPTFVPKDAGVLKMDMGHGRVKTLLQRSITNLLENTDGIAPAPARRGTAHPISVLSMS